MNREHYEIVKDAIGDKAELLVVSKYHTVEETKEYYDLGIRHFGENRMQELLPKVEALPKDIKWHFLGHLQKDKVKKVVPVVSMIQSLDSIELADKIESVCERLGKRMPCLVELHLAKDGGAKTGLDKKDLIPLVEHCMDLPHVDVAGIMVMGPNVENKNQIRETFKEGYKLFLDLQDRFGKDKIRVFSAGMSNDFRIALEEGSTQVRIGSYLF
ncbi:MAG: YggS family pyridoxal phosphate-dependent enzyme [Bacilli bacterium]|nr:YggS family pyridoxal phosphate-dependent enzyme [Bacilli bacterium]